MRNITLVVSTQVLRRGVHVAVHEFGNSEFIGAATCGSVGLAKYLAMNQARQIPRIQTALDREEVTFETRKVK